MGVLQTHFDVDLRIEISQSGNKHRVKVACSHLNLPRPSYLINLTKDQLDDLLFPKNRVDDGIAKMMTMENRSNQSWLDNLSRTARKLYRLLFPRAFFQDGLTELFSSGKIKVIQVITDGFSVPWELLYWDDELGKIESFVGYNAFVCRDDRLPSPEEGTYLTTQSRWMTTSGIPSIGGLFDFSYSWARKENEYFESIKGPAIQYEKLPAIYPGKKNASKNGRQTFKDFLEKSDWTISHFSCHAEYDPNMNRSRIRVSEEFYISLMEMVDEQILYSQKPLVFLNCCESGTVLSRFSANFADYFLSHFGASGVIGTPCIIDDASAGKFAKQFYKYLCEEKLVVSEAAVKARQALFLQDNDISGFYFMFFTRPDIGVTSI